MKTKWVGLDEIPIRPYIQIALEMRNLKFLFKGERLGHLDFLWS